MKYKSVKVSWYDGKKATIKAPRGGWLEYVLRQYKTRAYIWGYEVNEAHPFHMTNVYPDKIEQLAFEELAHLRAVKGAKS